MAKSLVDLPVDAGVYTEQSARGATGRWKDSDKVRFRYGLPEKIGGWDRVDTAMFIGLARRLWDWVSLDSRKWIAIGTESKLYLWQGGALTDITPLRRSVILTDPLDTLIGSDIVTITDPGHGAAQGDYVRISGANAVGGIIVDGQYEIQTIVSSTQYTVLDDQTASSTANGGGTVAFNYDIHVGLGSAAFGIGWGTGTWSQETWNTPRTVSSTVRPLRTWSLDNWGEDLIAVPRGGSVYWWDRGTGSNARANVLVNAPENVNYMIISQRDRHLFTLGCTDLFTGKFDPLLIRWCSKEDFTDWEPTSTNTSGDLRLYRGSEIQAAVRTRGEILVFTDVSVHQINFLGGSAVYGIQAVGENVSILGPNAAIEVDYRVYFMAEADFYIYDGVLRVLPSDVRNHVYENLNVFQKDKVFAGLNREFNEIWFFYPAKEGDVWIESDFTAGLLENIYTEQTDAGDNYTVLFNAEGYIWLETGAFSAIDHVYILQSGAVIEDPTDADYEVTFVANNTNVIRYGLVVEVTDLSGTADTAADNITSIACGFNPGGSSMDWWYTDAVGAVQTFTNAPAFVLFSTLTTPITITAGNRYAILLTRNAAQLTWSLWDEASGLTQQVATFAMTAAELLIFPGTVKKAGVNFLHSSSNDGTNSMQAESFRSAPGGVLVNQTQRGVSNEVNNYVIYNYEEETWAIGTMVRTAWADKSPVFETPYAASDDMYLYQHEVGTDDNGVAMTAFVESFDIEIPEAGDYFMHVDKLIPDFLTLIGTVNLTLKGKKYPHVDDYTVKGPYPVTPAVNKVSTRVRARQLALRLESDQLGDKWRMGTMRARVAPHGKRA